MLKYNFKNLTRQLVLSIISLTKLHMHMLPMSLRPVHIFSLLHQHTHIMNLITIDPNHFTEANKLFILSNEVTLIIIKASRPRPRAQREMLTNTVLNWAIANKIPHYLDDDVTVSTYSVTTKKKVKSAYGQQLRGKNEISAYSGYDRLDEGAYSKDS